MASIRESGIKIAAGNGMRQGRSMSLNSGVRAVAFRVNPDLPERFRSRAPLNAPDETTFHALRAVGYTDCPAL